MDRTDMWSFVAFGFILGAIAGIGVATYLAWRDWRANRDPLVNMDEAIYIASINQQMLQGLYAADALIDYQLRKKILTGQEESVLHVVREAIEASLPDYLSHTEEV